MSRILSAVQEQFNKLYPFGKSAGGEDNDIDDKGFRRRPEQRAANTFTSTDSQEVKCQ
jgi:hypothetical protein